jgi:hypothetical protein
LRTLDDLIISYLVIPALATSSSGIMSRCRSTFQIPRSANPTQ